MTQAQHTPGPWTVEPLQSTHGADMAICAPYNGWVVAVIQHDPDIQTADEVDGGTVIWHPADKANAAVLAAAPALLAALERLVAAWDANMGPDPAPHFEAAGCPQNAAITAARAAIAQARGATVDFINPSWQSGGNGPEVI